MSVSLNLASGQLPTSSGVLLGTGPGTVARRVTLIAYNTSGSLTETVAVSLSLAGASAKQVAQAKLAPNESLQIKNLPLNAADALYGSTTDAATVNYLVTLGDGGPFVVETRDSAGAVKQVNSGVAGNQNVSGTLTVTGNLTAQALILESATNGITAFAGGGQASATALTTEINRVTTVATAGDSVKLPASSPGLTIVVVNTGASPLQVYGAGTDTINGVASATGVSQMQASVCFYCCSVAGQWFCEGIGGGYSGSYPTVSYLNALTAHAGGGQGSATALTAVINRVTTVATAGDSVALPVSTGGLIVTVSNAAASNSMNVFPATGETINALGANAAFAVAAGKTAQFSCAVAGQWHSVLSA